MIEVARTTKASAHDIWPVLSDVESWPALLPTFDKVTRLHADGPVGVGAKFEVRQPGLPKAVYQITEWQPTTLFTWESPAPGVRSTASHRLEETPEGTRIVLTMTWSGPLAWLARKLYGSKARRFMTQEAEGIARAAEDAGQAD